MCVLLTGVSLNEGSHYDPDTSVFTCPLQGVYYVTVTYRKTDNMMWMQVYKDDNNILSSIDYDNWNPWNILSASCLVPCSPGEDIYVLGYADPGSVYGNQSVPYTTFSIFMFYGQGEKYTTKKKLWMKINIFFN